MGENHSVDHSDESKLPIMNILIMAIPTIFNFDKTQYHDSEFGRVFGNASVLLMVHIFRHVYLKEKPRLLEIEKGFYHKMFWVLLTSEWCLRTC